MTSSYKPIPESGPTRQYGGATLLVVFLLITAIAALALTLGHTAALEQRMTRNTLLAEQTRAVAQAGLQLALADLKRTRPEWLTDPAGHELATPTLGTPPLRSHNGVRFAMNIVYRRAASWQGYLQVQSSAVPGQDPDIEVQVTQFVRPLGVLSPAGEAAPPLVVDGCADLRGVNDIIPFRGRGREAGVSLSTTGTPDCTHLGHTNLHEGSIEYLDDSEWDPWARYMTLDRDAFRELAQNQSDAATGRDYHWAERGDLDGGQWRTSLGTADHPVVLIIPAELGCPAFSGGAQLVGLVLIEANCSDGPAWGDVRLYGSLIMRGDIHQLGPNARLLHISHAPGGAPYQPRIEPRPLEVLRVAGSWRDF